MAWREIIYQYDGSFEGLLCCVFESYTKKERPTAILHDGDEEPSLFEIRAVVTDHAHAQRIYRSLYRRSPDVGPFLRRAFLTCLPNKEMSIYRFIVKFYREGAPLLSRLSDETYLPLLKAVRHLSSEVEQFRGFTRFSDFDGVLGAEIEPKNRVLPMLRRHFCERYRSEYFSFTIARTARRCSTAAACRASCRSSASKWRNPMKKRRVIAAFGAAFMTPLPSKRAKTKSSA